MDWRAKYSDKVRSADEAVKLVASGTSVYLGMFASCPEGADAGDEVRVLALDGLTLLVERAA